MYSAAQLEDQQHAAQDILDGQPFESIRDQIENAAAHTADVWQKARDHKMPVASAIGHVCGTRAIGIVQSGSLPFGVPPESSLYARYTALTSGVDRVAGRSVIAHIDDMGPGFTAAFNYYAKQIDAICSYEAVNAAAVARRGKFSGRIQATPGDILVRQQTTNAEGNTISLIVREAIRICHEESAVPESDDLAQKLTARIGHFEHMTSLPGQVVLRLLYGEKFARRWTAALQTANPIEPPFWHHILRQQAEGRGLHELVPQIIQPITAQTFEAEVAKANSIRKYGNCAAQLALRPYEEPEKPGVNRALATGYFASHGIEIEDGAFRLVTYQLLRAIKIGQQTIFADQEARAALLTIARSSGA